MEYENSPVSTNYGDRTLQSASLNVDSIIMKESIHNIINNISTSSIDISRIRENAMWEFVVPKLENTPSFLDEVYRAIPITTIGNMGYFAHY